VLTRNWSARTCYFTVYPINNLSAVVLPKPKSSGHQPIYLLCCLCVIYVSLVLELSASGRLRGTVVPSILLSQQINCNLAFSTLNILEAIVPGYSSPQQVCKWVEVQPPWNWRYFLWLAAGISVGSNTWYEWYGIRDMTDNTVKIKDNSILKHISFQRLKIQPSHLLLL
jgi:hypothetical protein